MLLPEEYLANTWLPSPPETHAVVHTCTHTHTTHAHTHTHTHTHTTHIHTHMHTHTYTHTPQTLTHTRPLSQCAVFFNVFLEPVKQNNSQYI